MFNVSVIGSVPVFEVLSDLFLCFTEVLRFLNVASMRAMPGLLNGLMEACNYLLEMKFLIFQCKMLIMITLSCSSTVARSVATVF